jgi:hypothetical protein
MGNQRGDAPASDAQAAAGASSPDLGWSVAPATTAVAGTLAFHQRLPDLGSVGSGQAIGSAT